MERSIKQLYQMWLSGNTSGFSESEKTALVGSAESKEKALGWLTGISAILFFAGLVGVEQLVSLQCITGPATLVVGAWWVGAQNNLKTMRDQFVASPDSAK